MIFAALSEAADRGSLLLTDGGLCRFHLRRDGVVVIRELLVLPASRRLGLGRSLVESVAAGHPGAPLLARCPVGSEANAFWPAVGFVRVGEEKGVIVWRRDPS